MAEPKKGLMRRGSDDMNRNIRRMEENPHFFNSDDKEKLRRTFAQYDKDGNGNWDVHEFKKLLADLGHPEASLEECQHCFDRLDKDKSGNLDFNEFMHWWANFKWYDMMGTGTK